MLSDVFGGLVSWLVDTIGSLGYTGIVALMFLESSFFPFPSEVVMPPAGFLAHEGQMSLSLALLAGIAGSLLGALVNYWLSLRFGRPFFIRYGKHFGITPEVLDKADSFFERHGHISTFVGRLIPAGTGLAYHKAVKAREAAEAAEAKALAEATVAEQVAVATEQAAQSASAQKPESPASDN